MKKRVVSILLTGMAVLSLAACTSNGLEAASATNDNAKEAEAGTEKKEGISVYWVGKTLNNPWWISVSDFAQQTADNLGVDLTIAIPQEEVDLEKQVSMIEAAIEKKADAIVWQCSGAKDICARVEESGKAEWVRRTTGINLSPYFPASKLAWFMENVRGAPQNNP